jgi:hypothetical protein
MIKNVVKCGCASLRFAPVLGLVLASCATVHSAYMTNVSVPSSQGRTISASSSRFVFLAFNFDNEYAFEAQQRLAAKCPEGMVTGIFTTFETKWYVFFTDFQLKARGTCVQKRSAAADASAKSALDVAIAEGGAR